MEQYEKLVRDRIPEILTEKGIDHEVRVAEGEVYRLALVEKLHEEMHEFLEAHAPEELADLIEVIEALKALPMYAEVEVVREKKRDERGAFSKGYIVRGEK